MKEGDKAFMQVRKRELTAQIKSEEVKKKADRNHALITDNKKRIATIDQWLRDKDPEKVVDTTPMPKAEFKKQMDSVMGVNREVDTGIMEINSCEELDEVWDAIKFKNIQIKGPIKVLHYAKEKASKDPDYNRKL